MKRDASSLHRYIANPIKKVYKNILSRSLRKQNMYFFIKCFLHYQFSQCTFKLPFFDNLVLLTIWLWFYLATLSKSKSFNLTVIGMFLIQMSFGICVGPEVLDKVLTNQNCYSVLEEAWMWLPREWLFMSRDYRLDLWAGPAVSPMMAETFC